MAVEQRMRLVDASSGCMRAAIEPEIWGLPELLSPGVIHPRSSRSRWPTRHRLYFQSLKMSLVLQTGVLAVSQSFATSLENIHRHFCDIWLHLAVA
jgi:hypothetical protein